LRGLASGKEKGSGRKKLVRASGGVARLFVLPFERVVVVAALD